MRPSPRPAALLTGAALLELWEESRTLGPVERAIRIAAIATGVSIAEIASLPVGERDRLLLELREQVFGPEVEGLADCPHCGERVEMNFQLQEIATGTRAMLEFPVAAGGLELRVRALSSADLVAAGTRRELLLRCLVESSGDGDTETAPSNRAEMLSEAVLDEVEFRLAQADPLANIELDLTCPACGNRWLAPFDIAGFLWREIEVWARRMLREVHALARAYGWSESAILALSPSRRRLYLEMIAE